jgi:hypothetical protein
MNIEWLQQNWGLVVAGVLVLIVATIVTAALIRRSAGGQLRSTLAILDARTTEQEAAHSLARKTETKLTALQARSGKVKPRVIDELSGLLSDKQALAKIADDQLLIAKNHVRRVIHDEFPPNQHDKMRARYLPDDIKNKRPFSF